MSKYIPGVIGTSKHPSKLGPVASVTPSKQHPCSEVEQSHPSILGPVAVVALSWQQPNSVLLQWQSKIVKDI